MDAEPAFSSMILNKISAHVSREVDEITVPKLKTYVETRRLVFLTNIELTAPTQTYTVYVYERAQARTGSLSYAWAIVHSYSLCGDPRPRQAITQAPSRDNITEHRTLYLCRHSVGLT